MSFNSGKSPVSPNLGQVLFGEDGVVGWSPVPGNGSHRCSGFLQALNSCAEFNPCMIESWLCRNCNQGDVRVASGAYVGAESSCALVSAAGFWIHTGMKSEHSCC